MFDQRCIYLFMWEPRLPQDFFFMQKYSNQGISCKYIQIRVFYAEILVRYRYALRVTQSCAADYLDRTKPNQTMMDAMFILFQVPLINKNGSKSMHCIIRGKLLFQRAEKVLYFGSVQ